jgi:hypothetical protein
MPESVFKKYLSFPATLSSTVLSSTVLSLSLLAGCASSPEQPLSSETAEVQPAIQAESTAASAPEQNTADTEVTATTDDTTSHEAKTEPEVSSNATTETNITSQQQQPAITQNLQTPEAAVTANTATPVVAALPSTEPTTSPTAPVARSEKDIGNSYGIWTLKKSNNGLCKLSSPTLQTSTSNSEYSSQIWMDIEEQRIVVNAFMSLEITHPKTGIQIDDQALIPFTEKVYSTRAVVTGNLTTKLAQGNQVHIFINGKEVGKQVLKRDVKLTHMSSAINALQNCGK